MTLKIINLHREIKVMLWRSSNRRKKPSAKALIMEQEILKRYIL